MKLWSHQEQAINYAYERAFQCALNMGVATGKTATALAIIDRFFRGKTVYIVCPKTVIPQWVAEGKKFGLDIEVFPKLKVREKALKLKEYQGKILCFNYDIASLPPFNLALEKRPADLYVFDESQRVGNSTSNMSKAFYKSVKKSKNAGVLCLTGTFFHSSPFSCHGQLKLIDDTLLDFKVGGKTITAGKDVTKFRKRYGVYEPHPNVPVPILVGYQNLDELAKNVAKRTLVIHTTDVVDVPDEMHITLNYEVDMRDYRKIEKDLILQLKESEYRVINSIPEKLVKLRQVASGYKVDKKTGDIYYVPNREKLDVLKDLVDSLSDETFIVFTAYKQEVVDISELLTSMDVPHGRIVGGHSDLTDFQEGKYRACIVNVQSGGAGVDLSQARIAIYYNHPQGLGDYVQTLGRIRRPNSVHKQVVYYHLVSKDTIEETIVEALKEKKEINQTLVEHVKKGKA